MPACSLRTPVHASEAAGRAVFAPLAAFKERKFEGAAAETAAAVSSITGAIAKQATPPCAPASPRDPSLPRESLIDALGRDSSPAVRADAATSLGKLRPISQQAGYDMEFRLKGNAVEGVDKQFIFPTGISTPAMIEGPLGGALARSASQSAVMLSQMSGRTRVVVSVPISEP